MPDGCRAQEGRKDPYSLEAALRGAEAVIRSRPAELGSGAAEELALTLLTTRPEIDDDTWGSGDEAATGGEAHRRAALMALLVCYPQDCAEALASRLASAHLDAAQRLALLDAMEGAARELSGVFVSTDRRTKSRGSSARSSVADVGAHSSDGRLEAVLAGENQLTHDGRPRVRRWGHRAAALRAEAESRGGQTHRQGGRNDFGPLAPLFALPLMACFDRGEPGTGADLLHAPNAPVLARLLLALGSFAQCAGVYPTAVPVAASLLELLSAVSERAMGPAYVDEAAGISVTRAMLAAQAMAVGALPPPAVAAAFEGGGELVAILEAAGARAAAAAEGLGAFGGDEVRMGWRASGAHVRHPPGSYCTTRYVAQIALTPADSHRDRVRPARPAFRERIERGGARATLPGDPERSHVGGSRTAGAFCGRRGDHSHAVYECVLTSFELRTVSL